MLIVQSTNDSQVHELLPNVQRNTNKSVPQRGALNNAYLGKPKIAALMPQQAPGSRERGQH